MLTLSPELRAKRFPLRLPVKYRGAGEKRWFTGTTDNVSCSGMLIRGRHALSPAARVELLLTMPGQLAGDARVVAFCNGQVVRKIDRQLPSRDSTLGISVAACELLKSAKEKNHNTQFRPGNAEAPRIVQGLYDMLVLIVGSSEIILSDVEAGENAKQHAALIRKAAIRGGALLSQFPG